MPPPLSAQQGDAQMEPEVTAPLPKGSRPARWNAWRVVFASTLAVALVEVVGHYTVQSRVVPEDDWRAAAAVLRDEVQPTDTILVAPDWASPVARMALGDLMTEPRAAYSDLAGFTRAFELSARGRRHPDLVGREPTSVQRVGALTLREYALGESPVLFDLTAHLEQASVSVRRRSGEQPCPWRSSSLGRGGLGAGPMMPAARFECDPRHEWVFVGRTVNEDLHLRPRRCVWQHPAEAGSSVVTTFEDVPLGARLVLYAGLYYEHERMLEHPPFELRVHVDGQEVAHMTHRDGDGWKRIEANTGPASADPTRRGRVQVEVSAQDPHLRSVCWHADIRTAQRRPSEELP
ncbi:MAG: hypothetical protein IPG81_11510 [Sandaracinaceae bacterium]|nr:hypothetical protein [Sandaracinaceae bacterium]